MTSWALFALLWPVSDMIGSATLPGAIWNAIDLHLASLGTTRGADRQIEHPHLG